ncbi:DUF302 domain-containing protein [Sporosalibacterium faouarense]|uniref:DUF302 domain-containing protein n=1 Tax=Sporosalibacterium faouarense TaxID=516123 RepID=UPI00141C8DB2|nr:DUF302 domain-containing protein [Sporosalibacterium faouarense]MTI48527.1 DUF302 domain-containing protein [Bacillota bacterium]
MDINYKVSTSKSFNEAVSSLKENLSNYNFGVLWELNFKDKFNEKGLEFASNFMIFEVCNPSKAKEVLEQNIEIGFFLPCKLVVFEKEDKVFIGMPKPTQLIGMFEEKQLTSVAKEVEEELKSAINDAI